LHFFLNLSRQRTSETVVGGWLRDGDPWVEEEGEEEVERLEGCLKKDLRRERTSSWLCRGVEGGRKEVGEVGEERGSK